jgi:hypothetical protein
MIVGQSIPSCDGTENTLVVTNRPGAPGACPERALPVLNKAESGEGRAGHRGSIAGVEHLELHTVEADQSTVCRKPKVTVSRAPDRKNGVVRETVFRVVNLKAFLTQGAAGGEKEPGTTMHIRQFSDKMRAGIRAGAGGGVEQAIGLYDDTPVGLSVR